MPSSLKSLHQIQPSFCSRPAAHESIFHVVFVCHFHALCYHPHITTSSTVHRVAYIARLLISHTLQAYINDCVADSSCNWSCLLAKKVMSRSGSYAFIHNSLIFFLHPICYAWNHSRQGTVLIVTKEDGLFCASPLMVDC